MLIIFLRHARIITNYFHGVRNGLKSRPFSHVSIRRSTNHKCKFFIYIFIPSFKFFLKNAWLNYTFAATTLMRRYSDISEDPAFKTRVEHFSTAN